MDDFLPAAYACPDCHMQLRQDASAPEMLDCPCCGREWDMSEDRNHPPQAELVIRES